jgi:alpha-tubulin suppressor-like RCC1 family protein
MGALKRLAVLLLCMSCRFSFERALGEGQARGKLVYERPGTGEIAPASGARARIAGTTLVAVADGDGRFLFPDVPAGRHAVHARFTPPAGEDLQLLVGGVEIATRMVGSRTARGGRDLGTLTLNALGTVSGRVTRDGAPVRGAQVVAAGFGLAVTGADGRYALKLPRGDFDLAAVYADPTARSTAKAAVRLRETATVDFAATSADAASASIAGEARLADSDDHGGIRVKLLAQNGTVLFDGEGDRVETSGDGLWSAADVPAGVYTLFAEAPDHRTAYLSPVAVYPEAAAPPVTLLPDAADGADCDGDGALDADDADDDNDGVADGDEDAACVCDPGGARDRGGAGGLCDAEEFPAPDLTPPVVMTKSPAGGATEVLVAATVIATFSEAMDPSTLTAETFTLTGAAAVAGAVSYDAPTKTATFTPSALLAYATTYTASVGAGAKDLAGNTLAADVVWSFTTVAAADTTPPTVTSVSPPAEADNVALGAVVTATFSEPMNASTMTAASFRLTGAAPVAGAVAYDVPTRTASFTPSAPLDPSTRFTAVIDPTVTDLAGNAMAAEHAWSFDTAPPPDEIAPEVVSTTPSDEATGVAVNAPITATFSEAMDEATITDAAFTLDGPGGAVAGAVSYDAQAFKATFTPAGPLAYASSYAATIGASAADLAGNGLRGDVTWSFLTAATADSTPPQVVARSPLSSAYAVHVDATVQVTFSESMDASSVDAASFKLSWSGGDVAANVFGTGSQYTLQPAAALAERTDYTVTITTGAKDLAGNALAAPVSWSFTTDDLVLAYSAGDDHACAIRSDRTLWCWGNNDFGQLGDGTVTSKAFPRKVGALTGWKDVAAGGGHSCAIRQTGEMYCWGWNGQGQLGKGASGDATTPALVAGGLLWMAVSAGLQHTCALTTAGILYCWGDGFAYRNGDPTGVSRNAPYRVNATTVWTAIAAGEGHNCAMRDDGQLLCWGANWFGQLGDGTQTNSAAPRPVGAPGAYRGGAASFSLGTDFTCAVRADTGISCWGLNDAGQLGDGTQFDSTTPTPAGDETGFEAVFAGYDHACARKIGGELRCWGSNLWGQFANGTLNWSPSPVAAGNQGAFAGPWYGGSSGRWFTCAHMGPGHLRCFGRNNTGQLGGNRWGGSSYAPFRVATSFTDWTAVTANAQSCALRAGGQLYCWGRNLFGELGDGTKERRQLPVQVAGAWRAVAAGAAHSCGVKTDGTLWCWGGNAAWQLGSTTITDSNVPVQIGGDTDWASVEAGQQHGCAVKTDGTLGCWGSNLFGELGNDTTTNSATPVTQGLGWTAAAAGGSRSCGLKAGQLFCAGDNLYGAVGNGTTTGTVKLFTREVLAASDWLSVEQGFRHACGVRGTGSVGELWCWGDNTYGQLGTGGTPASTGTPTKIGTDIDWAAVSAGDSHVCAARSTGALYCWGRNHMGQLGDGAGTQRASPWAVSGGGVWTKVAAGAAHTCGIKSDGTLWCWGANENGQLGDGLVWSESAAPVAFP